MAQHNDNAAFSMQNGYVQTLLDPANHLSDIPDDIIRLHTKRQETVTYNLTVPASGSGLIVLWPNNPSYIVGAHYTLVAGAYVFDQMMYTAQNLSDSYDYGRKISQLITVKSSTLPSGVYALNGTMNSVLYQGMLSETTPISYGTMLSTTSQQLDKKGNVLVGNGVAVLSLPVQFDTPYVRMDDPDPTATGQTSYILDRSSMLDYVVTVPPGVVALPTGTANILLTTFNMDSLSPFTVHVNLFSALGAVPAGTVSYVTVTIIPLGLGGAAINTYTQNVIPFTAYTANPSINAVIDIPDQAQPVCACTVRVTATCAQASSFSITSGTVLTTVRNTNNGTNSPTALIAYQGVAAGSTMTVAGVSNYELIPNPSLQRNMHLTYGESRPHDMAYAKMMLSYRERLGIRSIFEIGEYNAFLARLDVYSDYSVSAESFDFSSLLRTIKNLALPVANALAPVMSAAFPAAAPVIGAANGLLHALMARSASGKALSASGNALSMDEFVPAQISLSVDQPSSSVEFMLNTEGSGVALFPVILSMRGQPLDADPTMVYAAITVTDSIRSQIPTLRDYPNYQVGEHLIYGCPQEPLVNARYGPMSSRLFVTDILLTPVFTMSGSSIATITNPPWVQGSSHELAACVASKRYQSLRVMGAPSALYTGGVSGFSILPVLGIELKRNLAHSLGLQLIGNSAGVDVVVEKVYSVDPLYLPTVTSLNKQTGVLDLGKYKALTVSRAAMSFQAWLHDGANQEYSDTYQIYAYSMDDTPSPKEVSYSIPSALGAIWREEAAQAVSADNEPRAISYPPGYVHSHPPGFSPTTTFNVKEEEDELAALEREWGDWDNQDLSFTAPPRPDAPIHASLSALDKQGKEYFASRHNFITVDGYRDLGHSAYMLAVEDISHALGRLVAAGKLAAFVESAITISPSKEKDVAAANRWDNNRLLQQTVSREEYIRRAVAGESLDPPPRNKVADSITNIYNNNQKLSQYASLDEVLQVFGGSDKVPTPKEMLDRFSHRQPTTSAPPTAAAATPRAAGLMKSLTNMWTNNGTLQKAVALEDFVNHFLNQGSVPSPNVALSTFPPTAKSTVPKPTTTGAGPDGSKLRERALRVYNNNVHLQATDEGEFLDYVQQLARMPNPDEVKSFVQRNSRHVPATTVSALTAKAERVWDSNARLKQHTTFDEFIKRVHNSGRVPTSQEIAEMLSEHKASPQGAAASVTAKAQKPINYTSYVSMLGPSASEAAQAHVKGMVDAVWKNNGNKGPTAEQNVELVSRIKAYVSTQKTPKGAANTQTGALRLALGGFPPLTGPLPSASSALTAFRELRGNESLA